MRYIRVFSELSNQLRYAIPEAGAGGGGSYQADAARQMEQNLDSVIQRIDKIEKTAGRRRLS